MDFRNLTYFKTVAEELSFTRAAEKLNMSQPPLSSQIRSLEEELGVQLLIRGKRKMKLTEEGRLLLERTNQILELAGKTRIDILELHNELHGSISLGMVEGRAPFLAAEWMYGFREEFPYIRFELWNGSSDDVIRRIDRGLSDIGIIAAPYDAEHLDGFKVAREPWVAILSKDNPLAKKTSREIPLRQLVGQPLIVPRRKSRIAAIQKWFAEIGAEPELYCTMSNYVDAIALTCHNIGIAIFPQTKEDTDPDVVYRLISEPGKIAEYYLVWRKGQLFTGAVQAFIEFVQDYLEEYGYPDDPANKEFFETAVLL